MRGSQSKQTNKKNQTPGIVPQSAVPWRLSTFADIWVSVSFSFLADFCSSCHSPVVGISAQAGSSGHISAKEITITFSATDLRGPQCLSLDSLYPIAFLVRAPFGLVWRYGHSLTASLRRNLSCLPRDLKVHASAASETFKKNIFQTMLSV